MAAEAEVIPLVLAAQAAQVVVVTVQTETKVHNLVLLILAEELVVEVLIIEHTLTADQA